MADIADLASDTEEQNLAAALRRRAPELTVTGWCHNCRESLAHGKFCDLDCREDWERRQARK